MKSASNWSYSSKNRDNERDRRRTLVLQNPFGRGMNQLGALFEKEEEHLEIDEDLKDYLDD